MFKIGLSICIISGPTRIARSTSIAADCGYFQWSAMTALEKCDRQLRALFRLSLAPWRMSVLQRISDFEIETFDAAMRLMLDTRKGTFSFMPHGATRPLEGSCSRDKPA
jgi:hypothetical protein